jgi:ABC-type dipeptide/oligopeptide/nickel transport system ATPase component
MCVRGLNPQQGSIFDDIIEQLADPDIAKTPFYLYLAGEAGTGKSYLVQTIIAAVKHINKKSGKNELEKPRILVIAPTVNAAFFIGGKTIDSSLAIHMEKTKFNEITAAKASQMAFNCEEVSLIICDEISMVGTIFFR